VGHLRNTTRGRRMTDDMLAAVTTAVSLKRGAYAWAEALDVIVLLDHNVLYYEQITIL